MEISDVKLKKKSLQKKSIALIFGIQAETLVIWKLGDSFLLKGLDRDSTGAVKQPAGFDQTRR